MLRWMDGFEFYGDIARMTEGIGGGAAWSQVDVDDTFPGWDLASDDPATGDYHMTLPSYGNFAKLMRRVFGVSKQVTGFGYRFKVDELPQLEGMLFRDGALILGEVRDATNLPHFTLILGTDGSIVARKGFDMEPDAGIDPGDGENGTVIGRSDPCVSRGGYHHFEVKSKIADAGGYLEVRVNEVTVLNLTGIDTQDTAEATAAQFAFGNSAHLPSFEDGGAAGFGNFRVDDVFAWDDDASDPENTIVDFVGDKGVYRLEPVSDTAASEFDIVPSAPAYGVLDERPPNTTDYLTTDEATARTIVGVAALPANVADIVAITGVLYAKKDESGSTRFRSGLVVGDDETYGPEDSPSTAFAYLRQGPKSIDPSTGVPWANDAAPKLLIERTA